MKETCKEPQRREAEIGLWGASKEQNSGQLLVPGQGKGKLWNFPQRAALNFRVWFEDYKGDKGLSSAATLLSPVQICH